MIDLNFNFTHHQRMVMFFISKYLRCDSSIVKREVAFLVIVISISACSASSGRIGTKKQTAATFIPATYITNVCLEGASSVLPASTNVIAPEDISGGPLRTNSVSANLIMVSGVGID